MYCQSFEIFKKYGKFGLQYNGEELYEAKFDSIILPDIQNPFCVLCIKKSLNQGKLIISNIKKWYCTYLKPDGKKIFFFEPLLKDTITEFSLPNDGIMVRTDDKLFYKINFDNNYVLFNHAYYPVFNEVYADITPVSGGDFFILGVLTSKGNIIYSVVNADHKVIIPPRFSSIIFSSHERIFIGCTFGLSNNSEDEILDLDGNVIFKYPGHIVGGGKSIVVVRSESEKRKYKIIQTHTGEELMIVSSEIPFVRDTIIEIYSKQNKQIYTFGELKKNIQNEKGKNRN
ncbi:MAG: hypothetical protein N3F09_02345 [Bacteroidia bacterium]|nr:hypothetical protein [Bacteroidia bacterium]